ncbi:MAG TPA: peptidoglycan DD-metalloendopeptidase family protein [Kofleriaceae bacterium]
MTAIAALGALGAHAQAAQAAKDTDPAAKARNEAKTAAKQLEAFFLRQMLTEARPQGGGALDGGFAGDTFKQMLDDAMADKMSAAGGVGMAKMFASQLGKGEPPTAAPTADATLPATPIAGAPVAPGTPGTPITPITPITHDGIPHFIVPVVGRPSSGYGMRHDPIKHEDINHPGFVLAAPTGTEVDAAAAGTITHAGPAGTYGNLVTVSHGNGVETRYAHLSAVDVKVGDTVQPGQDVGKVGTTGYSTGPHLHFEVRKDGKPIDPAPLIDTASQVRPASSSLHRSGVRTSR